MLYIVINVFIGGPLENQLVEGQPSLKELNMKYKNMPKYIQDISKRLFLICVAAVEEILCSVFPFLTHWHGMGFNLKSETRLMTMSLLFPCTL